MKYDVIIVGAGAAGLAAMHELLGKGLKVCILEAASQAGGRILTLQEDGFPDPVEGGAEFLHGELPLTIQLLKEAGIPYIPVAGDMVPVHYSRWQNEDKPDEHWNDFMKELKKLETDVPVEVFLNQHFSDAKYKELRDSIRRFAEGFDLADISKGSMLSLRNEWKNIDETQYRIGGGYSRLVQYMVNRCLLPDAMIKYNTVVKKITFTAGKVTVTTGNGEEYSAGKIIVTASLGVLQAGDIIFDPALAAHDTAIRDMGFGKVIKFLFQFNQPFWLSYHKSPGFILSNEIIPTWWTQLPAETNLLTGWLGGPPAERFSGFSSEELKQQAIASLAKIFSLHPEEIEKRLLHYKIISWQDSAFVKGGYSFNTLRAEQAKKILKEPVYDTIYFAGEAISSGESIGTVESAIQSGMETAKKITHT